MRLVRGTISDFGVCHEQQLSFDAPLTIVYGPNEAGKSTWLAFVRYMLFGYAPRLKAERRHLSQRSPIIGGMLMLEDDDGRQYKLERFEQGGNAGRRGGNFIRISTESGEVLSLDVLHTKLLGGLNGDTYRQLFAFGLEELQQLDVLQSEEINSYIYSAGLGLSPRKIFAAEKKLESEMEKLYKPRGRKQEVHKMLEQVQRVKNEITQWREQTGQYVLLKKKLEDCEKEIVTYESQLQELERSLQHVRLCLQAYAAWLDCQEKRKALASLPSSPSSLPVEPLVRLETLLSRYESLKDKLQDMEEKRDNLREQSDQLRPVRSLAERYPVLSKLAKELERAGDRERRIAELRAECQRLELDLDRIVRQSDANWTVEELRRFPATVQERDEVRSYGEALRSAEQRWEDLERELHRAEEVQQGCHTRKLHLERQLQAVWHEVLSDYSIQELLDTVDPVNEMSELSESIKKMREQFDQVNRLNERLHDVGKLAGVPVHQVNQKKRRKTRMKKTHLNGSWSVPIVSVIGSIALFLVSSYVAGKSQWGSFILLALAAVMLLVGGGALRRSQSSKTLTEVLTSLERKITIEQEKLQHMVDALLPRLRKMGFSEIASALEQTPNQDGRTNFSDLHDGLHGLEMSLIEGIRRQDVLLQELEREKQRKTEADQHVEWLRSLLQEAEQTCREIQTRWRNWLDGVHLPETLSPDTVLHVFEKVEHGLQVLAQLERQEQVLRTLQDEETNLLDKLAAVTDTSSEDVDRLKSAFHHLLSESRQHHEWMQKQQALRCQLDEMEQECDSVRLRMKELRQELQKLYDTAKVKNESDFRRVVEQERRRTGLQGEIRQLETVLEGLVGSFHLSAVQHTLAVKGKVELEEEAASLQEQLVMLQGKLNAQREQKGRLQREIERLQHAEEPSGYVQRLVSQEAELQQVAEDWSKRAFALALIRATRHKLEGAHQPGLIDKASRYFRLMTADRYEALHADWQARIIYALRKGERVEPARLSRGTAEQMLLSMRFALAEEQAQKNKLPILMDDILVNFDDQRMQLALQAIGELAHHHQIILFTCHESIRTAAQSILDSKGLCIHHLVVDQNASV